MAEDRVKPYDERASFIRYESLILLQNSALHQTVVTDAKTLISKGLNQTSAIKKSLKKHRGEFKDLFDVDISDSEDSEEEETDDGDSEEETS